MAICIACSWKSGTPRVRFSTVAERVRGIVDRLLAAPPAQVGMHHAALDRPGAHDRHLDDEVVELRAAASAAGSSSAPGSRPGRPRSRRRGRACRRPPDPRPAGSRACSGCRGGRRAARSALRMQVSMPSASTSTLRMPRASMSSLSQQMTVRSSIAAFSIGTSSSSRPSVMTKPPTCWERWRGKPMISSTSCHGLRQPRVVGVEAELDQPLARHAAAAPAPDLARRARRRCRG